MSDLTTFLRWLIEYGVSGGFWHFAAVYMLIVGIARIFNFIRVNLTVKRKAKKEDAK